MRVFLAIVALCIIGAQAESRFLHVSGKAGYLSEWEFGGDVTESISGEHQELVERLIWKHIGLCSVSGPPEKQGQIRMRLSPGSRSQLNAIISLDSDRCVYTGDFSGGSSGGYMECSDSKSIPLSISVK